jgi:hypothetical protein
MWEIFRKIRSVTGIWERHSAQDSTYDLSPDGIMFTKTEQPCRSITEVPEYWMDDIRPDDFVLDLGANAGAFCLRAARKTPHVTAVEPVTAALLRENVLLNGGPVTVIEVALGDGRPAEIVWDGCHVNVPTYPLDELIRLAGGCDFLKCDCEGAEWQIDPADLSGIRRIEMELHQPPIGGIPSSALLGSIGRMYEFTIDRVPGLGPLGQMGILHAWR